MEKETIILGAGESGVGAALLAERHGRRVFVSDAGQPADRFLSELFSAGIPYEAGGHDRERILEAEIVVKSPGIPDSIALVKDLRAAGIPVVSEIEYAYRYAPREATIVAITGSNGKTTTTLLTEHLLKTAGLEVRAGGNLGTSFARLLLEEEEKKAGLPPIYVLEISSFQLDGITTFRPQIAMILNITADHLDRYDYQIAKYADSKLSIAAYQGPDDELMIYGDDPVTRETLDRTPLKTRVYAISGAQLGRDGTITSGSESFDLGPTKLRGRHNALNALFAVGVAQRLGVGAVTIETGLNSFEPAPHRMEEVAVVDKVTYVNDSKATNVDAVIYALDAMQQPTIWIAGGTDKGNDYEPLYDLAANKVSALICLGLDNTKLVEAFNGKVPLIIETQSMTGAVAEARRLAKPGNTVLLSPACASFDLFRNYIDRGDQFRTAVKALLPGGNLDSMKSKNDRS